MQYLIALVVIAVPVFLVVQAVRGRVRMQSCCSVPVEQDLRMQADSAGPVADRG